MDLGLVTDSSFEALITAGNFRQALKNVDKKLKKDPKSDKWLTIRACVLYEADQANEALRICQTVAQQKHAAVEIQWIIGISQLIVLCSKRCVIPTDVNSIENLWQAAILLQKTTNARKALVEEWLYQSVELGLWSLVAKAATRLSRILSETGEHDASYYFWQAVGHWLSGTPLGQQLAISWMIAALEGRPNAPQITRQQEFLLLKSLLITTGQDARLMREVSRVTIGPECELSQDTWGVSRYKLESFAKNRQWQELWDLCSATILNALDSDARWQSDNWQFWYFLLKSCNALTNKRMQLHQFHTLATRSDDSATLNRSPRRASLLLEDDQGSTEAQVSAILSYFQTHCGRPVCSSDLREPVQGLSGTQYRAFRNLAATWLQRTHVSMETSQLTWVTAQTNLLELDLDILRRYSGPHSSSAAKVDSIFVKSLTNFITSCICLYQISRQHTRVLPKTDIDPADASCISGVKGLVLMWEITHRQRHILEAVCLLTYLVESSTYNASARLMLIDLLRYLGLFSLTLPAYQGLKVRGILAETCCPAMFTRISLMLPSALKHEVGITKDLGKCLKFYETSMAEIPQFQQLALQKKNYASVISMAAFSDRLRCSLTRRMLTQERRRCSRASNNSPAAFDIHYMVPTLYRRDEASTSTSESNATQSTKLIPSAPRLTKAYVEFLEYLDSVHSLLKDPQSLEGRELTPPFTSIESKQGAGLLDVEVECLRYATSIRSILDVVGQDKLDTGVISEKLDHLLVSLQNITETSVERTFSRQDGQLLPSCEFYVTNHVALECVSLCSKLTIVFDKSIKSKCKGAERQKIVQVEHMLNAMQAKAESARREIKKKVFALREAVEKRWHDAHSGHLSLGTLLNGSADGQGEKAVTDSIEALVGQENIVRILESFLGSAKGSLEDFVSA